jgi:ParB-like chromosome segregation protein Spo0J
VTDANGVPRSLPLSAIDVEEGFNPRTTTDEKRQAQLVESVRRHGILQPLLVAPAGEG